MNLNEQKLSISKISIVSFFLAVFSYIQIIFALIFGSSFQVLVQIAPLIMICFLVISFVLSIIDLTKKNRKKTFSVIALILSSIYFLLIIIAIVGFLLLSSIKNGNYGA